MISVVFLYILSLTIAINTFGTVYYDGKNYTFVSGVNDVAGVAWGVYEDTVNENGWGTLEIRTNNKFTDPVQLYAAGYLEGALTTVVIYQTYVNQIDPASPQVVNFLNQNTAWARAQATQYGPTDVFWRQVGLIYQQLDGLTQAYNDFAPNLKLPPLSSIDFQLLSGSCDTDSIDRAVNPDTRPDWDNITPEELDLEQQNLHCSALVKLLPDYSDLYFGHTTWASYQTMNRVIHYFYLDLQDPEIVSKGQSWSGYPGTLYSTDDYYITDQQLAIMETTNGVYNNTQYDLINVETLITWVRVRVANALSKTSKDWVKYFSRNWSGTYPNQWMVLDYKKFIPNQPLVKDTFWVLEEIPAFVHAEDLTQYLERGHWTSFNVPFYRDIYNASGYPAIVKSQGADQSYDLCPRAKIFRRDVNNVKGIDGFKQIMRQNTYQSDPFSEGKGKNQISSRYDLPQGASASAYGAIDVKLTTSTMVSRLMSEVISGPTTQGQPPFVWSKSAWNGTSHLGQPDAWNFPFVISNPTLF